MRLEWVTLAAALLYLCLLFAIAYWGDLRADRGRSVINTPWVYALSLAVYCTSWTFYGSVGRAASNGVGFLPIYIGPTLVFTLGWFVLRKIVRISKVQHLTTIADFLSSRYGKSHLLGGLVTVIAVVGIMPYISLQLKAVAASFEVLRVYPQSPAAAATLTDATVAGGVDTALWVTLILAAFSILFGTRHIDATEHHEGMVAAIAFESVVKLLSFLAVGVFVTFGMFGGFGDVFARAAEHPDLRALMTMAVPGGSWVTLTLLSMAAVMFLPRQFQVMVVENKNEDHLRRAMWLFPLYLFAINLFVLPIAFGGLMVFPDGGVDADTFVLALPMAEHRPGLALLVFLGGLSAATGMVIVATVALSTMICNDLVMPLLLRASWFGLGRRADLSGLLLGIRRGAIVVILLLGYLYYLLIGESYALVTIGLVSFAAAAQLAPAMLGGLFWKGGSRRGAVAGLGTGFAVWAYTLMLPSFARSGWLPMSLLGGGPWGLEFLRPYALFGLAGMDPISHALFWSLLVNTALYVGVSLVDRRRSLVEVVQAVAFVDVFQQTERFGTAPKHWRGWAPLPELRALGARFVGPERMDEALAAEAARRGLDLDRLPQADPDMVQFVERLLAGAIGAASARVVIASAVQGEAMGVDGIMEILDETSQVIEYSRRLEEKSAELEAATRGLEAANRRLTELDRLKDEFLSTVTHELRTPLTSIRSFSEILHDNPDLAADQRREFLGIVISESERLTRLINQVLDLAKIESGRMDWSDEPVDLVAVVTAAAATTRPRFEERGIALMVTTPDAVRPVRGDGDRLMQVAINLLSNAAKFCNADGGETRVVLEETAGGLTLSVADTGPGIPDAERDAVFDKFHQVRTDRAGNPMGSGLGLAISKRIVEHLGGRIWVESVPGDGATFKVFLPAGDA